MLLIWKALARMALFFYFSLYLKGTFLKIPFSFEAKAA
jgi:hypothetical protein